MPLLPDRPHVSEYETQQYPARVFAAKAGQVPTVHALVHAGQQSHLPEWLLAETEQPQLLPGPEFVIAQTQQRCTRTQPALWQSAKHNVMGPDCRSKSTSC